MITFMWSIIKAIENSEDVMTACKVQIGDSLNHSKKHFESPQDQFLDSVCFFGFIGLCVENSSIPISYAYLIHCGSCMCQNLEPN